MKQKCVWIMPLLFLGVSACRNPEWKLEKHEPKQGYRFDSVARCDTDLDSTFICLTFSGGGTRAAAFAYGVLQALHKTKIPGDARGRMLLDEVDLISAVSGGSFTAMAYAKWEDDLFNCNGTNEFRDRFLTRSIRLAIPFSFLTPSRYMLVPFVVFDLINAASFYYDQEIFSGMKYRDLLERDRRPFVVLNATDISRRHRFEFTQHDFDLLGADLAALPVGFAVAASSAFPILFSPVRFPYYHGDTLDGIVATVLEEGNDRRLGWARSLLRGHGSKPGSVPDRHHKYMYLLDGGLADNLGLEYVMESYRSGPIRERLNRGRIDTFVLIIVDAGNKAPHIIESRFISPNLFDLLEVIGFTAMEVRSAGLTQTAKFEIDTSQTAMRKALANFAAETEDKCTDSDVSKTVCASQVKQYVIDLNLDQVEDRHLPESKRLISTPTSLSLPEERVDALINAGRDLVKKHPQFKRLLCDLGDAASCSDNGP